MPPEFAAFARTTLAELSKQTDGWMKRDLIAWRDFWFVCLTISTLVVVAGLIGEYPELRYEIGCIYRRRFRLSLQEKPVPDLVRVVGFIGWLLIVFGVLGEGIFTIIVTRADTSVQSFNDALLAETNIAAGNAKVSAEIASWAASRANDLADQAAAKAVDAGNLAVRVNNEAGILATRTGTLQAQGDSLQKLINSGKEDLVVLKMSRTIENTPEWISSLKAYKDTEYAFAEVFPDAESIRLLGLTDSLLQHAEWKRVPLPASEIKGVPISLNPFSDCQNCFVPLSVREGVAVGVEEPNPPSEPTMFPRDSVPKYVWAAASLHDLLFAGVYPRDGTAGSQYLITVKGNSHTILISVGSKPEPVEPYDPKEWQRIRQKSSQAAKP